MLLELLQTITRRPTMHLHASVVPAASEQHQGVPDAVANWVANWARSEILKRAAGAPESKFRNLNTSFILLSFLIFSPLNIH